MLTVTIPGREFFNEETCEFVNTNDTVLQLEHSLVSLSKWESKWHKPFLSKDPHTQEETLDYIRCMTINKNVDPIVYRSIPNDVALSINNYIDDSMTATWFNETEQKKFSREVITSEIIYYWMVSLQIPFECEKWHLNRLLTLIRVCNIKNAPAKSMSTKDIYKQNRALNAARKKSGHTRG